jgi:type II secretory pathway component PulC
MSIINEALKKAEQSIHKNSAKETLLSDTKPAAKPYILYILILVAGLFLSNFIFSLLSRKINQPAKEIKIQATEIKTSESLPVIPPAPLFLLEENKVPETAFILNGIFFSDNHGYALVNNQIVRENDLVDGAKIKTITANSVELDNAGKIITLATQR